MQQLPPPQDQAPQTLMQRIDRLAGEVNGFLMIFAIGLAVLDLTCFVAFEAIDIVRPAFEVQIAAAQANVQAPLVESPIGR